MISFRIRKIASVVKENYSITDIGCDHGYLAICLRELGNENRVICADNKKGPLNNARKNLNGFSNIDYVLSDGLRNIEEITDGVVLAGMGFRTVKSIIENDFEKFCQYRQIIIQSNNSLPELRRWLNEKGFQIDEEYLVYDDIYYSILSVSKGSQQLTENEYLFGKNLLENDRELFRQKWEYEYGKREKLLEGIAINHKAYKRISNEMKKIREVL